MSEYGPVGHQIEIEVPGSGTWWGYTNAAPPKEMCCIDQLRTVSGPALLGAAFHEAGHAVVALHAGMPPVDLDVSPGAVCPRCGAQQAHGVNHGVSFSAAPPDDVLMVLAAGVQADLAQARICGPVSPAEQWAIEVGGLDDQHLARELVDLLPDDNRLDYGPAGTRPRPWNWLHQQQRAHSEVLRLWPRIEAVALRLLVDHRVPAADLPALALG